MNDFEATRPMTTSRVRLGNSAEVQLWCRRMHCSEQELRAAVYTVGGQPAMLHAYLLLSFSQRVSRAWQRLFVKSGLCQQPA